MRLIISIASMRQDLVESILLILLARHIMSSIELYECMFVLVM
jgi:hypothetical protein